MNRILKTPRRTKGIALLATLALLVFLGMMIAAVIRGNVGQRQYLKLRRSQTAALYRAESGVCEALHAIERQGGETALDRAGEFHVEWNEEKTGTPGAVRRPSRVFEIRSIGINDTDDRASAHRSVKVRALIPAGQPAKILSWEP